MTQPAAPQPPKARFGLYSGRLNRRFYWLSIVLLVAVLVCLGLVLPKATSLGTGATFVWIAIYARRLRDFGATGWWQGLLYLGQIVVGVALVFALNVALDETLGVLVILQFLFTVGLGVVPGQPGPNRFGPSMNAPKEGEIADTFR